MARIESQQLVAPKVFEPLRQEMDSTIEKSKVLSTELQNVLKAQAKLGKQVKTGAKGFRDLAAAEQKSKNALTEKEKLDKRILVLQKKSTQVTKLQRERVQALRVEEQRRNKVAKQEAQITNKNIGAFDRLNVKIKQLSDQYRNLLIQEGKETKQTKILRKRILELNAARDKANTNLGMHQAKVGQYQKAVGRLTGMLAKLGLAFGVFAIIRDTLGIIKNFDQASADLAAVLGVTRDEMAGLTEQAKELGATTKFTASEVSSLQLELAKLGFTENQIRQMTASTLELAAAAGTELGNAASIVGSTLRGFGLEASETQRLVDVMAKSFSSSSLDIEKFSSAMANVAPAAAAMGLTIEETTALIGTLTDAGIDASSAGTGLRNMFLNAKAQGISFEEALDKIANSTDQLGTSFDIFKKKGSVLGVILANNRDATAGLTETLDNAGGAAKEMADKQLDTLNGSLALLRSAWEGYILGADGSTGASEKLKKAIKFLADNFKTIMKVLIGGIRLWIAYKLQVILLGNSLKVGLIPRLFLAAKGAIASARGFKMASFSAKAFGKALKGIPFLAIISVIATVVSLFSDMGDETEELSEETSALEDATKELEKGIIAERAEMTGLFQALQNTNAGTKERQKLIDEINSKYGTTLQNLSDETAFAQALEEAYQGVNEALKEKLRIQIGQERRIDLLTQQIQLEDDLAKLQKDVAFGEAALEVQEGTVFFNADEVEKNVKLGQNQIKLWEKDLIDIDKFLRNLNDIPLDFGGGEDGSGGGSGASKTLKSEADIARGIFKDLQNMNKFNQIAIENDGRKHGENIEEIRRRQNAAMINGLNAELSFAVEHFGTLSDEAIKAALKLDKEIEKQEDNRKKREEKKLKDDRDNKDQAFADLKAQGVENLKILENNALKEGKTQKEISKILADERIENLKRENEFALKRYGINSAQYLAANLALNRALIKQDEDAAKKRAEIQKELIQQVRNLIEDSANAIARFIENNIKMIDRQIEAQKRLFDESKDREEELKEIAKERGLDASESINFEREAQKKALKTQQDLERKRQRAEALIAALQALAAQSASGKGNPVQNIKSQILNLKSFVEGEFYEGTPYTIADALGNTPGRDSHTIAIDNDESVLTGNQVRDLGIGKGGNSTDDIVRMYKNGFAKNSAGIGEVATIAQFSDKMITKKLDELIQETKNVTDPNGLTFNTITKTLNYKNRRTGDRYIYPISRKRN